MTEYDIHINNIKRLHEWISQQPSLVLLRPFNSDRIYCQFNHTTAEEIAFKQQIADRLFSIDIGNNTFENTLPNLTVVQTDLPIFTSELVITKNNIGTSFINYFTDYAGRSFFIDTTGYKKLRYQIFVNNNGATGTLNIRAVNIADTSQVLFDVVISDGQNQDTITIPDPLFTNFRGRVRLQVKSTVAADSPRFDAIRLYLIRKLTSA